MMLENLTNDPRAKLIGVMVLVAALLFTYAYGRRDGVRITEAAWMAEKAELNAAAVAKLDEANKRNAQLEKQAKAKLLETANSYEMKLGVLKNEKDRAIARARTDGLYINTYCPSSGDALPTAPAGSGLDSRIQRVRLPDEDADFLISFAADADRVAQQLTACQQILLKERE